MAGTVRLVLRLSFAAAAALAMSLAKGAGAAIVPHEYTPAAPADDLRMKATTTGGAMPAAIQTQSGAVASPDLDPTAARSNAVYGGAEGQGPSAFRIDGDTTRPSVVNYSDPFTPAVAPYKREHAYDSVDERLDLVVRDPSLVSLPVGGAARSEGDQFYADIATELVDGQAARIPTVGPGARLLAARSDPPVVLHFFRDSAENWFVRGERGGRFRIILHIDIDRAV